MRVLIWSLLTGLVLCLLLPAAGRGSAAHGGRYSHGEPSWQGGRPAPGTAFRPGGNGSGKRCGRRCKRSVVSREDDDDDGKPGRRVAAEGGAILHLPSGREDACAGAGPVALMPAGPAPRVPLYLRLQMLLL
jgi:hypothetical protein